MLSCSLRFDMWGWTYDLTSVGLYLQYYEKVRAPCLVVGVSLGA